jgi:hypothetical protein
VNTPTTSVMRLNVGCSFGTGILNRMHPDRSRLPVPSGKNRRQRWSRYSCANAGELIVLLHVREKVPIRQMLSKTRLPYFHKYANI